MVPYSNSLSTNVTLTEMKKLNWTKKKNKNITEINNIFWNDISEEAYPLSKGRMRVPISLEPFAITKQKNNKLQKDVSLVISAVKKLTKEYFKDEELKKLVSIDPLEHELIQNSKNMPLVGVVRIDLFYGKKPKIVEINADFPDGLFMHDITSKRIQKINGTNLKFTSNIKQFANLLKDYNVKHSDCIFVGHNKERIFLDEFELTKIKLKALGFRNVLVGSFEDLNFKNNAFYYKDNKVDVMRRGSELSKIRNIPGLLQNIIKAENHNNLKVINNFKMRLLGHKSMLAILHNTKYAKLFSKAELMAIKSLVPVTHKLEEVLLKEIISNKDLWVLKPSDLAEGDGVTIGTSVSNKKWQESITKASRNKNKWILQEKVEIPEETFNTFVDNKMHKNNAYYDFCPHVFLLKKKITYGNILVRFSDSEILNVMKGGGLTYLFEKR